MNDFREFSRQYNDWLMHADHGNTTKSSKKYFSNNEPPSHVAHRLAEAGMTVEQVGEYCERMELASGLGSGSRKYYNEVFKIFKENYASHSNIGNGFREFSELYHHGVKGMHWGIRRYQNPDGSLTDEGLKRYAGKHRRGLNQDERLLAEKNFNDKKRDIKNKYERNEVAKDEYKEKRKEYRKEFRQERRDIVKRNKQITDPKELESRYKAMRDKAINEIPNYRLKRGIDTANKVLDKLILAKNTIEGGVGAAAGYAMVTPLMTNPAVAAATIAFGVTGSAATAAGMSYLDSRIRNKIRRQFT